MLAVHVRSGLHRLAGGHLVELRAPGVVGVHLEHAAVREVELNEVTCDVVRELSANETDGNAAVGQIRHGTRNARHLFRVGHLELRERELSTTEDTEDTEDYLPALPAPPACPAP